MPNLKNIETKTKPLRNLMHEFYNNILIFSSPASVHKTLWYYLKFSKLSYKKITKALLTSVSKLSVHKAYLFWIFLSLFSKHIDFFFERTKHIDEFELLWSNIILPHAILSIKYILKAFNYFPLNMETYLTFSLICFMDIYISFFCFKQWIYIYI